MGTRKLTCQVAVGALLILGVWSPACGPTLPPTQTPTPADPTYEPLRSTIQTYVDHTPPYRREAAQAQESVQGKAEPTPSSAVALRTR